MLGDLKDLHKPLHAEEHDEQHEQRGQGHGGIDGVDHLAVLPENQGTGLNALHDQRAQ